MWLLSLGMADDDWDLGAVVRSCRPSGTKAAPMVPLEVELQEAAAEGDKSGSFVGFQRLFRGRDGLKELEELYMPCSPKVQQQQQSRWSPSPSLADTVAAPSKEAHRPLSQTPRSKRRKKQRQKVVCHVPADGLSSDVWAWRKYGQKPIKGSPYPRGYYRCSSSKACLARKQVDRSRADPAMFIITYTAEHNHPVPTHRNSLAGSTRHKFPSPSRGGGHPAPGNPSSRPPSSSAAAGLSPTTPLTASMEDELFQKRPHEKEDDEEDEDEGILLVKDMEIMGEDDLLFMGAAAPAAAAEAGEFDFGDLGDQFFQAR
ncbi:WRKY transcription factor [Musa troglodytarum]|uniref:WRKY transcription factor n=1 Tax=Musa troglodytarum TaxID=320322 RepID=A0A9E7I5I3_9LILI|nr:WRKY transcription factor [Musa troglodytarum]URE46200.1 WRKY transcription factor [Musa troglodytarum]